MLESTRGVLQKSLSGKKELDPRKNIFLLFLQMDDVNPKTYPKPIDISNLILTSPKKKEL